MLVETEDGRIGYVPAGMLHCHIVPPTCSQSLCQSLPDYLEESQAPLSQVEHVHLQHGHQDSEHFSQAFPFDGVDSRATGYDSTMVSACDDVRMSHYFQRN